MLANGREHRGIRGSARRPCLARLQGVELEAALDVLCETHDLVYTRDALTRVVFIRTAREVALDLPEIELKAWMVVGNFGEAILLIDKRPHTVRQGSVIATVRGPAIRVARLDSTQVQLEVLAWSRKWVMKLD